MREQSFYLKNNYRPVDKEKNLSDLRVIQGKIPTDLNGCLYRNGPNPLFPSDNKHWFEGDGMIHAISIQNGRASYQNRWVQTERYLLENQHGKSLIGSFMDNTPRAIEAKDSSDNTANTNIISFGNNLLALQETSPVIKISPDNLTTIGEYKFNNNINTMSAHPHIDYKNQLMLCHDYIPFSNLINYHIVNNKSKVVYKQQITAPYSSFMHDFAITEHYTIFPVMPLTFDMNRVLKNKAALMWESSKSSFFGIMPRYGKPDDMIWFEISPFYAYHFMNAYEEQDCIILDGLKANKAGLFPDSSDKAEDPIDTCSRLTRWELNLKTKLITETLLDNHTAEFPIFDQRFTGYKYKHGYGVAVADNKSNNNKDFNAIIHYDLQNNSSNLRVLENGNTPSEPVFVPKTNNSPEADGYILTVVYNKSKDSSELLILDALNINSDPITIIDLETRVPNGFHGNWVDKNL